MMVAVFDSYHPTSLARAALETARSALRSAQSIESQAKARVEGGLTVESDLLRSRVYLSTAKQQEIQAQGQFESAWAQLNRLMGDPLTRTIGGTASVVVQEHFGAVRGSSDLRAEAAPS